MSKRLAEALEKATPPPCPRCKWRVNHAPDCRWIVELDAENIEQARLLGIAGEEIAGLKARASRAEKERERILGAARHAVYRNHEASDGCHGCVELDEIINTIPPADCPDSPWPTQAEYNALRAKVEKLVAAGDQLQCQQRCDNGTVYRVDHAPMDTHDPRDGSCRTCPEYFPEPCLGCAAWTAAKEGVSL